MALVLTTALLLTGGLIALAAWIWMIVIAFRAGIGWGLLILLLGWTLIPVVIFAVYHWDDVKQPVVLYAFGLVLGGIGSVISSTGLEGGHGPATAGGSVAGAAQREVEARPDVLPPPRPTALPTHPSWEAVVGEIDGEPARSWESLVPSPTPVTGRPGGGGLGWDELAGRIGSTVVLELANNTIVTATLEAVEPDRVRVRHVIGGGEASYWIGRDEIALVRTPD